MAARGWVFHPRILAWHPPRRQSDGTWASIEQMGTPWLGGADRLRSNRRACLPEGDRCHDAQRSGRSWPCSCAEPLCLPAKPAPDRAPEAWQRGVDTHVPDSSTTHCARLGCRNSRGRLGRRTGHRFIQIFIRGGFGSPGCVERRRSANRAPMNHQRWHRRSRTASAGAGACPVAVCRRRRLGARIDGLLDRVRCGAQPYHPRAVNPAGGSVPGHLPLGKRSCVRSLRRGLSLRHESWLGPAIQPGERLLVEST